MESVTREGPYRSAGVLDAPFAPSLRATRWLGGAFAAPASLYVLASVWSLVFAPACPSHDESLVGQALGLLVLGGATLALGALGTRRASSAVRRRVRVRSWVGTTAWTIIAALPVILASVGMAATALYFDL